MTVKLVILGYFTICSMLSVYSHVMSVFSSEKKELRLIVDELYEVANEWDLKKQIGVTSASGTYLLKTERIELTDLRVGFYRTNLENLKNIYISPEGDITVSGNEVIALNLEYEYYYDCFSSGRDNGNAIAEVSQFKYIKKYNADLPSIDVQTVVKIGTVGIFGKYSGDSQVISLAKKALEAYFSMKDNLFTEMIKSEIIKFQKKSYYKWNYPLIYYSLQKPENKQFSLAYLPVATKTSSGIVKYINFNKMENGKEVSVLMNYSHITSKSNWNSFNEKVGGYQMYLPQESLADILGEISLSLDLSYEKSFPLFSFFPEARHLTKLYPSILKTITAYSQLALKLQAKSSVKEIVITSRGIFRAVDLTFSFYSPKDAKKEEILDLKVKIDAIFSPVNRDCQINVYPTEMLIKEIVSTKTIEKEHAKEFIDACLQNIQSKELYKLLAKNLNLGAYNCNVETKFMDKQGLVLISK